MSWDIAITGTGVMRIEATLANDDDADLFARAFNAARAGQWPDTPLEHDVRPGLRGAAQGRPMQVRPGGFAAGVLDGLRNGISLAGIAEALNATPHAVRLMQGRLIKSGHWNEGASS